LKSTLRMRGHSRRLKSGPYPHTLGLHN